MSLSREQALDCFLSDDLIGIGMEADAVRRRIHPEGVVTYSIDRRIDVSGLEGDLTSIFTHAAECVEQGGTGLTLQGMQNYSFTWVETALREIKQRFPALRLHSLSVPELSCIAQTSSLSFADTFVRLKAAGLDSIPGEGAELLGIQRWTEVHRAAHRAGLPTTASMTFGAGESAEDRVALLQAIRSLQQETSGFQAFTLQTHTGSRELDDPTAVGYLKTFAICRMLLDNIPHMHASWQQQGLKVLQMSLRFGGNDAGSALGTGAEVSEEELRRIIRDAGFRPAQRDTLYRMMFLN